MDFLDKVLSDSTEPVRTEVQETTESATDVKASTEAPASSAGQGEQQQSEAENTAEAAAGAPVRDEKGRFSKQPDTKPNDSTDGRNAALWHERERRRQLEAELEQLRAGQQKQPTSVFENEDKAIAERVEQHVQPLRVKFFNMSEKVARAAYQDYEEAREAFLREAENKPLLIEQLRASDDPGEFIYSEGLRVKELGEVGGDFVKYRAKLESKFSEKVTALETQLQALRAENSALKESKEKQSRIPQSLNTETSAASKTEHFAGPTPLGNILNS